MFIELPRDCDHVTAGDVVRFESAKQRFRILYRKNSDHNNFLVTERCDNYCLMCSQPPKSANDDWILEELFDVIRLLDEQTGGFGFTGGEPTLNDRFVELLKLCNDRLPDAAIHVLERAKVFGPILRRAVGIDCPSRFDGWDSRLFRYFINPRPCCPS